MSLRDNWDRLFIETKLDTLAIRATFPIADAGTDTLTRTA